MKRISSPVLLTAFLFLIILLSFFIFFDRNNDNNGVQAQGFKGQGNLAFVRHDLLYTLNGTTGEVKQITDSGRASQPAWSHDGQWLAYLITEQDSELWLVRKDGSAARPITGLPQSVASSGFFWSPTANLLAVIMPDDGIWLVPAAGKPYRLVQHSLASYGLAWSPDGNSIAYSATLPLLSAEEIQDRSNALYTIGLDGGQPVELLVERQAGIHLAAWWPDGKGLLYWTFYGASQAYDGTPLYSFRLGDSEAAYLAAGLSYQGWLSLSPQGDLIMVSGMDRIVWANKSLAIINPVSGARQNLANPAGCVSLDPAFSPAGDRIAFVAAKDLGDEVWGFNDPEDLTAWVNTRTLWLAQADGSTPRPLTSAGTGVYQPLWAKDGKTILYVRDNALWLINSEGGQPEKIADLLSEGEDLFGFYGYLSYQDLIAWHQP